MLESFAACEFVPRVPAKAPASVSATLWASGWLRMLRALLAYLRVDSDSVRQERGGANKVIDGVRSVTHLGTAFMLQYGKLQKSFPSGVYGARGDA
jgi:hypothetical protein